MQKWLFSLVVLPCCLLNGFAQLAPVEKQSVIAGSYDGFSVDNFGNIYLVKRDVIKRFSADHQLLFTASLKTIRPTFIESSKSFRILLFDQDRSVVQFLDNTLTAIHEEIDLVNLGIQQPISVCESFEGNAFWVLDAGALRLVKLNEQLEKVVVTENLRTIFNHDQLPTQMLEVNDRLYVMIPQKGVAIFDIFGTFVRFYPCRAEGIDAMDNHLAIRTKEGLDIVAITEMLPTSHRYTLPPKVIAVELTADKLYLLDEQGVSVMPFAELSKQ